MPHRTLGIICASKGWGGLEINTLQLCEWLRERGWRVHLLSAPNAPLTGNARDIPNSVATLGLKSIPKKTKQLRLVHSWVLQHKIEVLLIPNNKDLIIASLYKRFINRDIAIVYQQHMQVGVSKRDFIHTLRYKMIDKWIAPLNYLKAETLRLTRIPEWKIVVIPFGIDVKKFGTTTISKEESRNGLRLPNDAIIIGCLGRIDAKKGQDLLIKALPKLRQKGNYQLLLMGNPTENEGDKFSKHLQHLIVDSGLERFVHLRPYGAEVMQFYRAIDVFAIPSHCETFGMVTIEAMAAGVPVIGTDNYGTRELLGAGEFGYLFEKENESDFIGKFLTLEADSLIGKMVENARNEVLARYSKGAMVSKTIKVLVEAMNAPQDEDFFESLED